LNHQQKQRRFGAIVGRQFLVVATLGHLMDLPENRMGVDIENTFEPEYVVIPGKKRILEG